MKPTKRKAFNFLRSYFDVFNELKDDKDKLDFLTSIINKQFLNEDPKDLSFIVKLCYESQRHSIESSVKGWIRVNKTDILGNILTDPTTDPMIDPMIDPTTDPMIDPKEEKEKEKEKVEVKEENNIVFFDAEIIEFSFDDFWSLYPNKTNKKKAEEKFKKLTKEQKQKIELHLPYFINNKPFKDYNHPHAITYLNQERYNDEIQITNTNLIPSQNELNDISKQVRLNNSKL
jgi:predicted GIY-YIG superfamily endonuclease